MKNDSGLTVSELIEQLKKCPQEMVVLTYYDGEPRNLIDLIYVSNGVVVLADEFDAYRLPQDMKQVFPAKE
jgi:hypothetical protein